MDCILASDVVHRYGAREALHNAHLRAQQGQLLGLLGPNGGGKSTLLGLLSTRLKLQQGSVRLLGLDVMRNQAEIRRRIGVVFQRPALDRRLTVEENLTYAGQLYGLWGSQLRSRMDELLGQFRLNDRRQDIVETLSGGLARRAELAKALLHRPEILLLDEPSTGLDPAARRDLWNVLHSLRDSGVTVVVSTHLAAEGEQCDQVVILNQGQVVASGIPDQLRAEVGKEILTLTTDDAPALMESLKELSPRIQEGRVRLETADGATLVGKVMGAASGLVRSLTLSRPSLEDVFFQRTGLSYEQVEEAPASFWPAKR